MKKVLLAALLLLVALVATLVAVLVGPERSTKASPIVEGPSTSTVEHRVETVVPVADEPIARTEVEVSDARKEPESVLTADDISNAASAYFAWLNGREASERAQWFAAPAEELDHLPAELGSAFLVRLADRTGAGLAYEALYRGWLARARTLDANLLGVTMGEFDAQDRGAKDLWNHTYILLLHHLGKDAPSFEAARTWTKFSQYVITWVGPDAGQVGEPKNVLMGLFYASTSDDAALGQTLELVEDAHEAEVIDGGTAMYFIALLPSLLDGRKDLRVSFEPHFVWLSHPERASAFTWGYVELLRSLRVKEVLTAEDVASETRTPEWIFEEPERASSYALMELLSLFGGELGGARLDALFGAWLARFGRGSSPSLRDMKMLVGFAASAEGGLGIEDVEPLLRDEELVQIGLEGVSQLAKKHPGNAGIADALRRLLGNPLLDAELEKRVFRILTENGMAREDELFIALEDPELEARAFQGLLARGYYPDVFLARAERTARADLATSAYHAVLANEPERGIEIAKAMMGSSHGDVSAEGISRFAAIAAFAELEGDATWRDAFLAELERVPASVWESKIWNGFPPEFNTDRGNFLLRSFQNEPEKLAAQTWIRKALEFR